MTDKAVVLVIEDDADVRLALTVLLGRSGLRPLEAPDGRSGLRLLHEQRPDCVVVDVGLPDMDGWSVLERIRDLTDVPVLMLTARHLESDKVRGLQTGADDYMTKPFGNQELVARVQALLRRAQLGGRSRRSSAYDDGYLTMDQSSHSAQAGGREVDLTPLEFRLLSALVESSPNILSATQLLETVWNDPTVTGPDRVKYVIHRLRRKVGLNSHGGTSIEAVRGVGYRYRPPT